MPPQVYYANVITSRAVEIGRTQWACPNGPIKYMGWIIKIEVKKKKKKLAWPGQTQVSLARIGSTQLPK